AALAGTPAKNVVVDLEGAGHIGPAALGVYLRVWKGVRDRDGGMVLCNVSRGDRDMLCATRLTSVWAVCPTREEGVAAVKGGIVGPPPAPDFGGLVSPGRGRRNQLG